MRETNRPHFLELVTYRWRGHVGPREDEDVGVRRKDDLAMWKGRDPIARLASALVEAGQLDETAPAAIWDRTRKAVAVAWADALTSPYPVPQTMLDIVYTASKP